MTTTLKRRDDNNEEDDIDLHLTHSLSLLPPNGRVSRVALVIVGYRQYPHFQHRAALCSKFTRKLFSFCALLLTLYGLLSDVTNVQPLQSILLHRNFSTYVCTHTAHNMHSHRVYTVQGTCCDTCQLIRAGTRICVMPNGWPFMCGRLQRARFNGTQIKYSRRWHWFAVQHT